MGLPSYIINRWATPKKLKNKHYGKKNTVLNNLHYLFLVDMGTSNT